MACTSPALPGPSHNAEHGPLLTRRIDVFYATDKAALLTINAGVPVEVANDVASALLKSAVDRLRLAADGYEVAGHAADEMALMLQIVGGLHRAARPAQ